MSSCWGVPKQVQLSMKTEVLFRIDLWELVLQKLEEILVSSNPPNDNKNDMGNMNMEESKKDGLDGENSTGGTKCCLIKIKKLTIPSRVALLQNANIWVGDSGASAHCTNNRHGNSNIHEGSGTGIIGAHGKAMTASSIMDIAGTWCNKFGEEQLKANEKNVQNIPKANFNLFSIGKAIKKGWKLSGNQEELVLMKGSAKLVFNVKVMTQNGVIFCAYLQRKHEFCAVLASAGITMSTEKAHIMTRHHDEEKTHHFALELGWP